ncbi:MAG TPA: M23 family metallopeptidase [Hyphomicrobiales bacterium]|nr:M23 family metallopeptidase [Hyphomicrobiales bacterium]
MTSKDEAVERPFGRRSEPHKITIAREGRTRSFTVRPWAIGAAAAAAVIVGGGYLAATGYLVYRDQILAGHYARQAAMQHRYEDRIATLRAEIDRITSRQMIDKEAVEAKIDLLLDRKQSLDTRTEQVAVLIDRARGVGIAAPIAGPLPEPNPSRVATAFAKIEVPDVTGSIGPAKAEAAEAPAALPASLAEEMGLRSSDASFLDEATPPRQPDSRLAAADDPALPEIARIEHDFAAIEAQQATTVTQLAEKAAAKVKQIRKALSGLGYDADKLVGEPQNRKSVGGPFVPVPNLRAMAFGDQVDAVARSLSDLDHLRQQLDIVPLARPIRGAARTTSRFGVRLDPFLNTPALHAGIDFKAAPGHPVLATGRGTVVRAGYVGGYGKLVEIDHGNGVTTRYAHLSAILVEKGATVRVGQAVGKLGSTGRSTGPHLHYETRINGEAVDPMRFLEAGRRIRSTL